jgi:ribonuclease HI
MLLNIDRTLQLLSEGKPLEKIAELAECSVSDVTEIIMEARRLLALHEKPLSRKKVILKKGHTKTESEDSSDDALMIEIFDGSELSAIPYASTLTIYTDGASKGNPGESGIGIVIFDDDQRQVGRVSSYIGLATNNIAEYTAVVRALKIGIYFKAKSLRIRTDSELVVKQLKGEYKVKNEELKKLYDIALLLKKEIPSCTFEHVTRNFNDKADYLASKAALSREEKSE